MPALVFLRLRGRSKFLLFLALFSLFLVHSRRKSPKVAAFRRKSLFFRQKSPKVAVFRRKLLFFRRKLLFFAESHFFSLATHCI